MDIVLTGRHIQIKQKFRDVVESKMNRVTAIAPTRSACRLCCRTRAIRVCMTPPSASS